MTMRICLPKGLNCLTNPLCHSERSRRISITNEELNQKEDSSHSFGMTLWNMSTSTLCHSEVKPKNLPC